MIDVAPGLRQIGSSYTGKEPLEHVADVLQMALRSVGGELGFEVCLTSRPFTSCTFEEERLGAFRPGRDGSEGAEAAARDLADAVALLREHGFSVEESAVPEWRHDLESGPAFLAGPLAVPDRWCPPQERILAGGAWRYLIVQGRRGERVICLDPIFGGSTGLLADDLTAAGVQLLRVDPPARPPDPAVLAEDCLRRGTRWRREAGRGAEAARRDGAGLRRCAERSEQMLHGSAAQRLRLSLAVQALQSFRWSGMLGRLPTLDTDTLALADALAETVAEARRAATALRGGEAAVLAARLRALATLADGTTELSARLAGSER